MPKKVIDISKEFNNILKLVNKNKLTVNLAKTKELFVHRPNVRNYLAPAELPGIEQFFCAKPLHV